MCEIEQAVTLIIGGSEKKLTIGKKAENAIKFRLIQWKNFKDYFKKSKEKNDSLRQFFTSFFGVVTSQKDIKEIINDYIRSERHEYLMKMEKLLFLHEPLAWTLRELFFKFVRYYENLLRKYVEKNGGDWNNLIIKWTSNNPEDTSSKPLWNLTRDEEFKNILSKDKFMKDWVDRLCKKWSYKGFCPKVPGERFKILMEFPIWELITITESSREEMEIFSEAVNSILQKSKKTPKMNIPQLYIKPNTDHIAVIDDILEYEKKLLPSLIQLETHYIEKSKLINSITLIFPCGCS